MNENGTPHSKPSNLIGSELLQEDPGFADIVMQFVENLGKRLSTMDEAIQASDFEALRAAAHQLKGSGGGYGYPILTELAASLERQAKAAALAECTSKLAELKEVCQRVVVDTDSASEQTES
ncbi:MAG: Hpt domain-containing protein [Planctomycetes bacterium]|nr:Hpt domain-containing protein [Planctomycetota bacterium]